MLEVQKYLASASLEQLADEYAIKVNQHDNLPLVILNYNQIESPKTHPIIRECRGLVLNSQTFEPVARSFNRFFNWGEVQDEQHLFDFTDFTVQSKEDGSLALLYHFNGWRTNTRGSFATDNMEFQPFTWHEGILKSLKLDSIDRVDRHLDQKVTYVCEFCSPWNKVVRKYDEPTLYLLTAFVTETGEELSHEECDKFAQDLNILRPTLYQFSHLDEIKTFLQDQSENDPTFEGVVIRDCNNQRWKIKSATYLGLHRLKGDSLFNPKHLIPFILTGEEDELLVYFPEVKGRFYEIKSIVNEAYISLLESWLDNQDIEDRKDFAIAVKDEEFAGFLFHLRNKLETDGNITSSDIKSEWRDSEQMIFKKLFYKKLNYGLRA